ncbi:ATP synthase [Colletotrichum costaricense]|uniref:ATP synthase subunit delta, mitochondrial n=1 Tax=Colletotrichum costaricense TaxID=1209916 RepID=A0AAI9YHG6_9PEZI|nr:ATP synthase [Colletotrichum costaricense]KAK1510357.1 ATP synthase [Colletotrichum costaricense]
MNSFRFARAALRARPAAFRAPLQRRTYADAIKLSLSLPHQSIYQSQDVVQVNIPADSGEMGVLANHVPAIEQLKPGLVEVVEESGPSKQFFLSGGFAVVQPNSVLSINATEGYPIEDFSAEAVKSQLAEAQKVASGSGSELEIAEAKIEVEVSNFPNKALERMEDPFVDNFSPPRANVFTAEPEDGDIPEGLVSARRQKFSSRPSTRVTSRKPSPLESRVPSQDHSFFGQSPEQASRSNSQAPIPALRLRKSMYLTPPRVADPDSMQLRQTASTGRLRARPSRTLNRPPKMPMASISASSSLQKPRHFSNNSVSSIHSCGTDMTTSTIRKRHARDIFAEFGISRPSGWLSDDEEEDFSRHRDGTNSIPRHVLNTCHSCGAEVTSRTFCSTCGHAVIEEHIRSSSSLETTERSKKNQRAPATSVNLDENPFILADRMTKITTAEPQITDMTVGAGQASRLSDCVPRQTDLNTAETHGDYGNPRCNATHAGHHSGRHSIACIAEQQSSVSMDDSEPLRPHLPLEDPVQNKIDQIYHHAEDLRRAQHIMEHLATGSAGISASKQNSQHTTPFAQQMQFRTKGLDTNREKLISFDAAMAESNEHARA